MSSAIALVKEQKTPAIFPSAQEWEMLKEQASIAIKSGLLPSAINTPEKAIAIALKGRELGIPPMHAFAHIHIIQGKPCISAELQLALVFKNCHGAVIHYAESSARICTIEATRPGGKAMRFSFSIEEATQAKLMTKDSWRNYPAAMLRARCISIVARALFADAIMGCSYTPEEMGAEVNDEGDVIDLPTPKVYPSQPEVGDGVPQTGPSTFMRAKGSFAKMTVESIPPADLRKEVERLESLPTLGLEEMQFLDRAKALLETYDGIDPEEVEEKKARPVCECGSELVISPRKGVYYCAGFKNPGTHIKPMSKEQYEGTG